MIPARHVPRFGVGSSPADQLGVPEVSRDPRLRVTIVFTTTEGTLAALRTAGGLAENLGAQIALVVTEVVPFYFPVGNPPVAVDFLERRYLDLVLESGIQAEEVNIEIYLCRDRNECLRKVLNSPSLVIIGARRRRWPGKERRLERYLRALGHHVIFVEMEATTHARSLLHSYLRPVFRRVLAIYQGL